MAKLLDVKVNGEYTLCVTHADYRALEDECERLRARVGEVEKEMWHWKGEYNRVERDRISLNAKVSPLLFAAGQAYAEIANSENPNRHEIIGRHVWRYLEAFL